MPANRDGVRDWLVQRLSAIVMAAYTIFILAFIWAQPTLDYATWDALFANQAVRIVSAIVLLNVLLHAWLGLWRVTSDYLTCSLLRLITQGLIILILVGLLAWGIAILWGV